MNFDSRVEKIQTPEKCEIFIKNARRLGRNDLAEQAKIKKVHLRSQIFNREFNVTDHVDKAIVDALIAYEEVLLAKHNKNQPATKLRQSIKSNGLKEAAIRAVSKKKETKGYIALKELGLEQYTFEAVIAKHPEAFDSKTIAYAKQRLLDFQHS